MELIEDENTILERFYEGLMSEDNDTPLILYHSSVYGARALLQDAGFEGITLRETHEAMYHEGLLPADEYGFSKWFVKKWKVK